MFIRIKPKFMRLFFHRVSPKRDYEEEIPLKEVIVTRKRKNESPERKILEENVVVKRRRRRRKEEAEGQEDPSERILSRKRIG